MKVVILGKQDMLDEDIIRSINELEESSKIIPDLYFRLHLTMVQGMNGKSNEKDDKRYD